MFKWLRAKLTADAPSAAVTVTSKDLQDMHAQILRQNRMKRMERNEQRRARATLQVVPRTR